MLNSPINNSVSLFCLYMIHCSIFLCGCLLHSVSQLFSFLLNIFTVFISCFVVCFNLKMCFKKRAAAWALIGQTNGNTQQMGLCHTASFFFIINLWMNYNEVSLIKARHFCSTVGINCWPCLYVIIDMESHFPSPNNDLNMILCTSFAFTEPRGPPADRIRAEPYFTFLRLY